MTSGIWRLKRKGGRGKGEGRGGGGDSTKCISEIINSEGPCLNTDETDEIKKRKAKSKHQFQWITLCSHPRRRIYVLISHLTLHLVQLIPQYINLPLNDLHPLSYQICSMNKQLVVSCLQDFPNHFINLLHSDAHVLRGFHRICHLKLEFDKKPTLRAWRNIKNSVSKALLKGINFALISKIFP